MSYHTIALPDLVIANGATDSNILYAQPHFRDADTIKLYGPTVMPETVTVYVSPVGSEASPPAAGDWRVLVNDSGANVTVPAGKAISIDLPSYGAIKLVASGAVAAARTIAATKGMWA